MKLKIFGSIVLALALATGPVVTFAQDNTKKPGVAKPQARSSSGGGKTHISGGSGRPHAGARVQQHQQMRVNRGTTNVRQGNFNRNRTIQNKTVRTQKNINRTVVKQRNINRNVVKQQKIQNQKNIQVQKSDRTRVRSGQFQGQAKSMQLSSSQRLRIGNYVRAHRFHRLTSAGFPLVVGGYVPRSYSIYDVPEDFVEYVPEYEGYKYIVVGNELLIIDPETWEIVAVIPI